jgi:hypothetical protein
MDRMQRARPQQEETDRRAQPGRASLAMTSGADQRHGEP